MSIQNILSRLDKVTGNGKGDYRACCPSHQSQGRTLSLKELDNGSILLHCFAGCSPVDVMEAIGMSLSDLYDEPLQDRIRPLYMARQEKKQQDRAQDEISSCELLLALAQQMRERGEKLTLKDMADEKRAYLRLRELQQRGAA